MALQKKIEKEWMSERERENKYCLKLQNKLKFAALFAASFEVFTAHCAQRERKAEKMCKERGRRIVERDREMKLEQVRHLAN